MTKPTIEQLHSAEVTWGKAWRFAIQPLVMLLLSLACFFVLNMVGDIKSSIVSVQTLISRQGETLSDLNGKVNYGVIQRIDALERQHGELQTRVSELEREKAGIRRHP